MEFKVSEKVFELLPDYQIGIVAAKGIDNAIANPEIVKMLNDNIKACESYFEGKNLKETEDILPFRQAFKSLGMNPNKFMSSIEALLTRISKKKGFPSINPIVDLGNSVSIKYHLPIGAHDIDTIKDSLEVRFSNDGDTFIPFGDNQVEYPENDELLYVSGNEIRTRRWIWRQSEIGKITEDTENVFFPIDGFGDKEKILKARDELARLLKEVFDCQVVTGFVDKDNMSFEVKLK